MPHLLADLADLPPGSHAVSFYSAPEEAAQQAVQFISGAPKDQPTSYWVSDPATARQYNQRLETAAPDHVGCVVALGHEQVELVDGQLRPCEEVREFLHEHAGPMTAAGETLSQYWSTDSIPQHLEYESWFQEQPRDGSRFVCPYDLRRIPAGLAPAVMKELGQHHTHVKLSSSPEPAVRLLQLFIFGSEADVPLRLQDDLESARDQGWVAHSQPRSPLELTAAGREIVREWSDRTTVNW